MPNFAESSSDARIHSAASRKPRVRGFSTDSSKGMWAGEVTSVPSRSRVGLVLAGTAEPNEFSPVKLVAYVSHSDLSKASDTRPDIHILKSATSINDLPNR